jgi:endo-1,3(4)-beta-glucanase
MDPDDIFRPVATDAPSAMFDARSDHPAPRLGIVGQGSPIGTNKFYANFFLGSQTAATWTHPYSVAWSKGGGTSRSWGMSVSHIDESQKVFGPDPNASTARYFINPIGIQSLVLSALELGSSTSISMDSITAFSANVNILPNTGAPAAITFPLVQGMAFVTAIYHGTTPILETGVFFRSLFKANSSVRGVTKYVINLEDGKTWLLYAYSAAGDSFDLSLTSNCLAKSSAGFNGTVQIAKLPVGSPQGGDAETLYDRGCGVYPTSVKLSGEADGSRGSYTLTFDKAGITAILLTMFALPHHVESFSQQTVHYLSRVRLNTTTKGMATAVVGDSWTFAEFLPITMSFVPWNNSSPYRYITSEAAASVVYTAAESEILQDMTQQTNLDSMYFSGKV